MELVAYSTFPKLEIVCDCSCHLILCAYATLGPMVDLNSLRRLLFETLTRVSVTTLLADAGFDTEANHRFARDGCGVRSVIPPLHGRPTDKLPSGPHRRGMKFRFDHRYGQRWQIETVMSMIKRNLGSYVAARSDRARGQETLLKVLTHNIMLTVVVFIRLFYRASDVPFEFSIAAGGNSKLAMINPLNYRSKVSNQRSAQSIALYCVGYASVATISSAVFSSFDQSIAQWFNQKYGLRLSFYSTELFPLLLTFLWSGFLFAMTRLTVHALVAETPSRLVLKSLFITSSLYGPLWMFLGEFADDSWARGEGIKYWTLATASTAVQLGWAYRGWNCFKLVVQIRKRGHSGSVSTLQKFGACSVARRRLHRYKMPDAQLTIPKEGAPHSISIGSQDAAGSHLPMFPS